MFDVGRAAERCVADLPWECEEEAADGDETRFFPFFVQGKEEYAGADEDEARAADVVGRDDCDDCRGECG